MTLIAKPVIDKQFWILQDKDRKVGNVEACEGGFLVTINNRVEQVASIKVLAKRADIKFEPATKTVSKTVKDVHGYEISGRFYNPTWDVKHKLPLFTKTNKSKSWIAAGWYQLKQGKTWEVVHQPKLILLQRYPFKGPFHTKEEATNG